MFDKSKDYGLCGQNSVGKRYYQNGKFFNSFFVEVDDEGNVVENAPSGAALAPVSHAKAKPIGKPRQTRKVAQKASSSK